MPGFFRDSASQGLVEAGSGNCIARQSDTALKATFVRRRRNHSHGLRCGSSCWCAGALQTGKGDQFACVDAIGATVQPTGRPGKAAKAAMQAATPSSAPCCRWAIIFVDEDIASPLKVARLSTNSAPEMHLRESASSAQPPPDEADQQHPTRHDKPTHAA